MSPFLFTLISVEGVWILYVSTACTSLLIRVTRQSLIAFLSLGFIWFSLSVAHAQEASSAPAKDTSYAALADLLDDQKTRDQLITQLRELAAQPGAANNAATPPVSGNAQAEVQAAKSEESLQTTNKDDDSIAAQLQVFATGLSGDIAETWLVIKAMVTDERLPGARAAQWKPAVVSLGVAIVSVVVAYFLLRLAAGYAFGRLNDWTMRENAKRPRSTAYSAGAAGEKRKGLGKLGSLTLGRKLLAVIGAFVIDIAATLLAALAAYGVVIAFTDSGMPVSLFAMQFLTAFVLVEVVKAISRGIFATHYEHLRLLPLSEEVAGYWNRWLIVLITITGYSLLVIVPVVQALLTPGVGQLLGLVLMATVYLYAISVVWQNRKQVSAGLREYAERSSATVFGTLIRVLARIWHWVLLAYLTVLFVVSQADQQDALSFMAHATIQSAVAILIGALLAAVLSSLLARRIQLPDNWRRSLPLVEERINAYVPALIKCLRLLILIVVTLVVLDAWDVFDLIGWLGSESGRNTVNTVVQVGIILLIAALSWTILASIIEHRLGVAMGTNKPTEREKTLLMLFRSAASVVISTMTVLIVLSQIGINIGPLIAGAGVAGLAIGFGAQKLVQDVITGIFIQLENGMNQNDTVEVAGLFGTVEKITIRSVVIRTLDGGYHLIPFSTIDKLSNHTRDFGYHYGEYNIGHRESVDEAIAQLELAFAELKHDPELAPAIMEDISIPGVTGLTERGFTIRVLIKTTPGMQWAVQRGFNRLVKKYFDAAGIELPYPQTVLHFGRDKNGYAAPVDVRAVEALSQKVQAAPAGQTPRPISSVESAV
jgi:small-conductance mechanosensitive channel